MGVAPRRVPCAVRRRALETRLLQRMRFTGGDVYTVRTEMGKDVTSKPIEEGGETGRGSGDSVRCTSGPGLGCVLP